MGNVKVLIADDDHLNRLMFGKLLEKLGYDADAAENGKIALDKSRDEHYSVVFLDYNMPGLSGAECADRIKRDYSEKGMDAPLIVGISADCEHESNPVFDRFLPKPFEIELIMDIMKEGGAK